MLNITQNFIPEGRENRPALSMVAEYICIHDSGKLFNGDITSASRYLNEISEEPAWHFSVDIDNNIIQHLPLNENAWHCGDEEDGDGNRKSIAIEMIINRNFTEEEIKAVQDNCIELIVELISQYKIPIENIKQHYDFNDLHNCPYYLRRNQDDWALFINKIKIKNS